MKLLSMVIDALFELNNCPKNYDIDLPCYLKKKSVNMDLYLGLEANNKN